MRFDDSDRADPSQVEDRRGQRWRSPAGRPGVGVGGLGVAGTLVYIALQLLAGSGGPLDGLGAAGDEPQELPSAPGGASLAGSCRGVTSESDPAKFIVCVETNVQAFWRRELGRRGGEYRPSKLVLFTAETPGGCGPASAETGPFYCPADERVY